MYEVGGLVSHLKKLILPHERIMKQQSPGDNENKENQLGTLGIAKSPHSVGECGDSD